MLISNRNLLLCLIKILMNGERELKIACRKNNWLLFYVLLCSSLEVFRELFLYIPESAKCCNET